MIINIARDYSEAPGGAFESNLGYSGERFREECLYPEYIEALKFNNKIIVDFDGGYGYLNSFLEEAFGGLVRQLISEGYSVKGIQKRFVFISNDNLALEERVRKYMDDAIKKAKKEQP